MTGISVALVKELREETNVGMMECKKALIDAGGDKDKAIRLLRERGLASVGKRAARVAKEGRIAADISQGGNVGVMVEVNCETDFVAKTEQFQAFVATALDCARTGPADLGVAMKDATAEFVAKTGENTVARRYVRFEVSGHGQVASYIHLGGKIGVLIELGCEKPETTARDLFLETAKDVTLHVAACSPQYLQRSEVPEAVLQAERDIYAKQVENKPPQIVEKIVSGKIEKFYSQVCLIEQGFVKDPETTVADMLAARGKLLDDALTVRRFVRFQLGEQA